MPSIYTLEGAGLGFADSDMKPKTGCKCFKRKTKKGKVFAFQLCKVEKSKKGKGSSRTGWKITGRCPTK
jgi:hypothetical protein